MIEDYFSVFGFDAVRSLRQSMSLIIIMEICKGPTLRLKALNKHTHIMYIEMENVIQKINMYISTSVEE